ncbi:hypothetical protein DEU56DRAFT_894574 [Suillus clintonianus]|uniref:uncharacterized protein n=1 Tax=Suillus clintonianus TaxID=1904413 RepID=UPI001B874BDC|nr:uncharacterized protein DEU56DRAFT_894574 [Suillus clintonianus]KAG2121761.1 hypothetical protein DEU56DRAFT_894574 [Suillus clintonianus]
MPSGAERRRRKAANAANARRTPTPSPPGDDMPLAAFFAQFASFSFNENQSSNKNYDRLIKTLKCSPEDTERRAVREGFKDALVQEFNERFGTDGNDISNWQNLCNVLRIDPVPDTIEDCRKFVWDTHVNLVDLVDSARTGKPVKLFASLEELKTYTLGKPGKIFPKENAYQGGLLKELLREIIHTYHGSRRNGSAKRKERKRKRKAARTAAAGGD